MHCLSPHNLFLYQYYYITFHPVYIMYCLVLIENSNKVLLTSNVVQQFVLLLKCKCTFIIFKPINLICPNILLKAQTNKQIPKQTYAKFPVCIVVLWYYNFN